MKLFQRMSEFSPEEHRILLITCPGHFFTHLFTLAFPAIAIPLTTAFGMPLEAVVKLSFWMYLLYGVLALPVGLAADRWRAKPMLVAGIAIMGTGLIVAGAYPNPIVMTSSLALVGVGASIYHPAGLALISRAVRLRGVAMGVNGVFGNLGIALAPLLTGALSWAFGWQTALIVLGAIGLITAAWLQTVHVDETIRPAAKPVVHDGVPKREMARYFVILCVALVLGGIAYRGNMLLLPAYMELKTTFLAKLFEHLPRFDGHSTATFAATVLASIVLCGGLFGQMVGGRLADRMELRRAYLLFHAASFPFVLAMAFSGDVALVACAVAYEFFSLGMQPIENSLIAAMTPDRWRSTSYAVKFLLNFGIGAVAVHLIAPIKQAYSIEMVYAFLAGVVLLLVLTIVVLMVASRKIPAVRN
ncbi:MAG: MFS transporter [Candidatus Latescibacteria bacterium]|nr:MFS transporter [Candidatus Latescibacterota bacterium]